MQAGSEPVWSRTRKWVELVPQGKGRKSIEMEVVETQAIPGWLAALIAILGFTAGVAIINELMGNPLKDLLPEEKEEKRGVGRTILDPFNLF